MRKYLDQFNQFKQDKGMIDALIEVIEQYSGDYYRHHALLKKDEVCIALERFYDYIFDITQSTIIDDYTGKIIIEYDFEQVLPYEIRLVFETAKKLELEALIEKNAERTPSPLVTKCENEAAGEGFSPESIFAQTAILERALINNQVVRQSHRDEVKDKINEWALLLVRKFSGLILTSTNLVELNELLEQKFNSHLSQDLPILMNLKSSFLKQINILKTKNFFNLYYKQADLAQKFNYVSDFYYDLKEKGFITPELKTTMSYLFFNIIDEAYRPVEKKKHALMTLSGSTVKKVFDDLEAWIKSGNESVEDTDLFQEILSKIQKERKEFEVWEEASHRIHHSVSKPYRTYQPLMQNLYCMRFAGDPNQDPRALLAHYPKPVASPIKYENKRKLEKEPVETEVENTSKRLKS